MILSILEIEKITFQLAFTQSYLVTLLSGHPDLINLFY